MRTMRIFVLLVFISSLLVVQKPAGAYDQSPFYHSPVRNAEYVHPETTLAIRYGPVLESQGIDPDQPGSTPAAPASIDRNFESQNAIDYLTLPDDIPPYSILVSKPELIAPGYIFWAPFQRELRGVGAYMLIMDNQGEIVYHQYVGANRECFDFKVLRDGRLAYACFSTKGYFVMDNHYQVVDTYLPGNGYDKIDRHDFLLLENGHALFMVYHNRAMDLTSIGGRADAQVTELIIQELDQDKNVVFEWRSLDHPEIEITDTYVSVTTQTVDYMHGNAIDVDHDGNILLTSFHLNEVTKIDRQTGEIIWRLGGKKNQFDWQGQPMFNGIHDARRLQNGNLSVFSNETDDETSQAVEYKLDEVNKTVTREWFFEHEPPVLGPSLGNVQELPNGNFMIGWGAAEIRPDRAYIAMTEAQRTAEKTTVFELALAQPFMNYRAFRFPWKGDPLWPPDLAFKVENEVLTLGFSWNGATEIASYKVFWGTTTDDLAMVGVKQKTGFETQMQFTKLREGVCYFRVMPVDKAGENTQWSNLITTNVCPTFQYFFPLYSN